MSAIISGDSSTSRMKSTQSRGLDVDVIRWGEKNEIERLVALINSHTSEEINKVLRAKLERKVDCITFWNYLLLGFDTSSLSSREKRFACVKCFLDGLLRIEFTYKQTFDLISRLCQDLSTFPADQLIEIVEYCCDGVRTGDPKCIGWKDLLPETLNSLTGSHRALTVNDIPMSGSEYRETIVKNLYTMRWSDNILIPLADMFKELQLSNNEVMIVLNKFCSRFETLSPDTLPALAYQLFSMCRTALHVMVPILALDKYFHRHYYKKLFADMDSNTTDLDSIDSYSDDELRESEETILHHLDYCTQYKINESQMGNILKNFLATPDVILTPFIISAILAMSINNREPNMRLSASILLPFLRKIIYNNEEEKKFSDSSVWCRDSLQRKQINLEQIFTVLINQNKDGRETVTPGLVNLAFVLLRHKTSKEIQELAIKFIIKFVRKRFIFGHGIVKKLTEWMIVEQDQNQYAECLNILSVTDTFTLSECSKSINYVLNYLLWISSEQSMRMISFLLPILKISAVIRESFIDILRKAMGSSNDDSRKMAVYGLCMILKQLNYSNSQRSQFNASVSFTQHSISGYSLMSQLPGPSNRTNSQRHFDMLTLEIIGLLRCCLQQSRELKYILYENLQRAVELNVKLVPHVLQFIDWHFRSYFSYKATTDGDNDAMDFHAVDFQIHFERLAEAKDDQCNNILIHDNLGRLLVMTSHCLLIFESFKTEYNTREMTRLIQCSLEMVIGGRLPKTAPEGNITLLDSERVAQKLNLIEGLMGYCVLNSLPTNNLAQKLWPLFKVHEQLRDDFKCFLMKRTYKKAKQATEQDQSTLPTTCWIINGQPAKKPSMDFVNIWDLVIIERLLSMICREIVPFASSSDCSALRSKTSFVRYVLSVSAHKIDQLRSEPDYKQLAHSRRILKYLTDITKLLYEGCVKRLSMYCSENDVGTGLLAAECFHQCLKTANRIYRAKFNEVFLKGFDTQTSARSKEGSVSVLQANIDALMKEEQIQSGNSTKNKTTDANDTLSMDSEAIMIVQKLFDCLDILYEYHPFDHPMTTESYTWLLHYCQLYPIETKSLTIVHKLLFRQRRKTHSGAFFQIIPLHLAKIWSFINDDIENEDGNQSHIVLKSITEVSAESCLQYLYESLQQQHHDIDYFIVKANNLCYKRQLIDDEERDSAQTSLLSLERSICSQLVHLSQTLKNICNVCLPLGASMDGLIKLLIQHYTILKNFAKHYQSCMASGIRVSLHGSKFNLLLKIVGKPLATNIYTLITYIEGNILDDSVAGATKKSNPKTEKARVLRETKHIPKLIFCIENFNKEVILLAKRDNDKFTKYLHFGTVRDFRIRTADLKAAIEKSLGQNDDEDKDVEEDQTMTKESSKRIRKTKRTREKSKEKPDEDSSKDDDDGDGEEESTLSCMDEERENHAPAESTTNSSMSSLRVSTDTVEDNDDSVAGRSRNLRKSRQPLKETTEVSVRKTIERRTRGGSSKQQQQQQQQQQQDCDIVDGSPKTLRDECQTVSQAQMLMNLAQVNKEAVRKRRRLREANERKESELAVAEDPPPPFKKRLRSQHQK